MRLFAFFFALTLPAAAQKPSVLLLSVDGLRPDAITAADAHGLKVPRLRRFMTEGSYATGVVGSCPP